ncbi:MAG: class I SAM-dependent methyltransferase [Phycisphaerales bacterium]|nr:MAG: class I SAM-dependent methyltransferase [Phycisphaerales bacterium]
MTGTSATLCVEAPEARSADDRTLALERARRRLEHHAAIWHERPLTRDIYRRYHLAIDSARSDVEGADVEVGAGHGSFAEFRPGTLSCDIVPCPWLHCAADAAYLPFADGSLANIIMIDVLHHVADPLRFFEEACRTLAPGGRAILLEPYVSPVSYIAWRYFHDEAINTRVNPFSPSPGHVSDRGKDPWQANIAVPTLIFWRHWATFARRFPQFHLSRRERFDLLVMPLSGGFERRRLIPLWSVPLARAVESCLRPLAPLMAFRCLIVLEKR